MDRKIAEIRTHLTLLKWIGVVQITLILLVVIRVWFV